MVVGCDSLSPFEGEERKCSWFTLLLAFKGELRAILVPCRVQSAVITKTKKYYSCACLHSARPVQNTCATCLCCLHRLRDTSHSGSRLGTPTRVDYIDYID